MCVCLYTHIYKNRRCQNGTKYQKLVTLTIAKRHHSNTSHTTKISLYDNHSNKI